MKKLKERPFYMGAELAEKINELITYIESMEGELEALRAEIEEHGRSLDALQISTAEWGSYSHVEGR